MMYFLYHILCSDNSIYTGIAKDVCTRILEHNKSDKGAKYTKTRRPVKLISFRLCGTRGEATSQEIKFKQKSRTEKLATLNSYIDMANINDIIIRMKILPELKELLDGSSLQEEEVQVFVYGLQTLELDEQKILFVHLKDNTDLIFPLYVNFKTKVHAISNSESLTRVIKNELEMISNI